MAEEPLKLEICAPEDEMVALDIQAVMVPGEDGVFTVRAGHTPFLTTLLPGVLEVTCVEGDMHFYAVHGGFAEVRDNVVRILADTFEARGDIDLVRNTVRAVPGVRTVSVD